jgi:glycine oxidase
MMRRPDIVIIGAGIIGCSVAYELARRGASVQVVEQRAIGMGATQAAAGILAPHLEIRAESAFLELAVRSLNLFDAFVASVRDETGNSIAYRRTGTLQVAASEDGMREITLAAAQLAAYGITPTLLDTQSVREEEPHLGHDIVGGLVVPVHGFVSAVDLVRALAAASSQRGVEMLEGRCVHRISPTNGGLLVETDRGPLQAPAVVLAGGSWSGRVAAAGVPPIPVRPVRGQLLRLAWKQSPLVRTIWGDRCYIVPWQEGTVLVGATVEDAGFDETTTVAGVRGLLEAACDLVPGAWTAGLIEARVGLRPASPDLLPIIGASTVIPNLMYATAHYRNGILLAPLTAAIVADALLERRFDAALTAFSPRRFGEF